MKITVVGTGYVGLTTGVSLANLGHSVLCIDIDENKVNQLEAGNMPFYEPGLKELVERNKEKGRLSFSSDIGAGIKFAEVIFNCVWTPQGEDGSADLSAVFSVTEKVAEISEEYKILINKSTVPPGTARKCTSLISLKNPHSSLHSNKVEVVSNPEFLKQGNAVYDFNHPDKIVVGASSERAFQTLRKVYHGLIKTYIPFLEMDWETAEMIKYANNSFLATKISFINEIANICDKVGADVRCVAKAIGMDYRVSPKFLNAGIGYGGSCFPKDVKALINTAREKGYDAGLLREVDGLNERQKEILLPRIIEKLQQLRGKTVTFWGLSFKPKTSDLRGSASLTMIKKLLRRGYSVKVHDPVITNGKEIGGTQQLFWAQFDGNFDEEQKERIICCDSVESSVIGSDMIVLATEWDEFRNVDFIGLGSKMNNKILFDGRNIYEPEQLKEDGFEYFGVGR